MFTYLNPEVRKKLIERDKLVRIDTNGHRIDTSGAAPSGQRSLNLLGPVPLPLARGSRHPTAQWYATVRSTELSEVENLAGTLREQGGQHLFSQLASSMAVNSVLIIGDADKAKSPLVETLLPNLSSAAPSDGTNFFI